MDFGDILGELLRAYCRKLAIPWKEEGLPFFRALQKELMANMAELVDQVPEASQRMWTSFLTLRGKVMRHIRLNFHLSACRPMLLRSIDEYRSTLVCHAGFSRGACDRLIPDHSSDTTVAIRSFASS